MWQEGISFAMGLPCRDRRGYGREGICHQIKVAELHQLPSDLPRRIFAYFEYRRTPWKLNSGTRDRNTFRHTFRLALTFSVHPRCGGGDTMMQEKSIK